MAIVSKKKIFALWRHAMGKWKRLGENLREDIKRKRWMRKTGRKGMTKRGT